MIFHIFVSKVYAFMSEILYSDEYVTHELIPVTRLDGSEYLHHKLTSGTGYGCVAVCMIDDMIAFVELPRPVPALAKSLELPRGMAGSLDSSDDAFRELLEETSLPETYFMNDPVHLGIIYQDTGLMDNRVSAWLFTPSKLAKYFKQVSPELESAAVLTWLPMNEIRVTTRIQCAITLATLKLLDQYLARVEN